MKIKLFLLAILAAAAAAALGSAPARADGFSIKLGYSSGHYGHHHGYHKRHYRKHRYYKKRRYWRRHWRRHHHGHYHPHWRPHYPRSHVYIYKHYREAPSYYDEPAYTKVAPAPAPAPVVKHAPKEEYCREYTREVVVDGRPARAYGQACRQPDGSWRIVSEQQPVAELQ